MTVGKVIDFSVFTGAGNKSCASATRTASNMADAKTAAEAAALALATAALDCRTLYTGSQITEMVSPVDGTITYGAAVATSVNSQDEADQAAYAAAQAAAQAESVLVEVVVP